MPSFLSLAYGLLAAAPLLELASAQINGVCPGPVVSSPNPIGTKQKYNRYASTGTVNGTYAIMPIPLTQARSMIPSQYPILQDQYQQLFPTLGADQYPLLLQMDLFYDIYKKGVSAGSGANYQRAAVSFPFVDRLNDGQTAMTYNKKIIISNTNTAAQTQYQRYGGLVASGFFANCNAYEFDNNTESLPPAERRIDQAAWADTNTNLANPSIAYRLTPTDNSTYSLDTWYTVLNQPLFSDKTPLCDSVVRLPDTVVTTGANAPVFVEGDAAVLKQFFNPTKKTIFSGILGIKLDQAYYERPQVNCANLAA